MKDPTDDPAIVAAADVSFGKQIAPAAWRSVPLNPFPATMSATGPNGNNNAYCQDKRDRLVSLDCLIGRDGDDLT